MSFLETKYSIDAFRRLKSIDSLAIFGFDMLFLLFAFIGLKIYTSVFIKITEPLQDILNFLEMTGGQISPIHQRALDAQSVVMQNFIVYFLIASVLLVLYLFFIWALSRSLIWSRILNKKTKPILLARMFAISLLWGIIIVVIVFALFFIMSFPRIAFAMVNHPLFFQFIMFLVLLLISYFSVLLYCKFAMSQKIIMSFVDSIKIGFIKIESFLVPIIVLASFLLYLVYTWGIHIIVNFINLALLLIVIIWVRYACAYTLKGLKV